MNFFINGEKINVSLENEKTAGDIFKSFAAICEENSAAVTQIKINGKIISCNDFDEVSKNDLHENDIFEFNSFSGVAVNISGAILLRCIYGFLGVIIERCILCAKVYGKL